MTQNHPKRTTYTPRFLILALATLLAVVLTGFAGSGLATAAQRRPKPGVRHWRGLPRVLGCAEQADLRRNERRWIVRADLRPTARRLLQPRRQRPGSHLGGPILYASTADEWRALGEPQILDVTTLRKADGQPFTASDFDGEGLTLTRDNDCLYPRRRNLPSDASRSTEPSWKSCRYPRSSWSRRTDRPPATRPSRASL